MADDDMTRKEYWDEIRSIRASLIEEWHEERAGYEYDGAEWLNERMHSTIDGHQWIIYTAYNIDVIRFTDNREAYYDQMGEWPNVDNFDQMLGAVAFMAMEADVQDGLDANEFDNDQD